MNLQVQDEDDKEEEETSQSTAPFASPAYAPPSLSHLPSMPPNSPSKANPPTAQRFPSEPPPILDASSAAERVRAALHAPDYSVPNDISALEVAQLCQLFLGSRARSLWLTSILALHVAAMWACCAIWTNSLNASLPMEHTMLLLLCAGVLLPLSMIGGTEIIQPFLAAATLSTLSLMCILLMWALCERAIRGEDGVFSMSPLAANTDELRPAAAPLIIDLARFGPAFATFLFAYIVQQSVPTLQRSAALPSSTRLSLTLAIGTCSLLYVLLGGASALYFGRATKPLITLNFGESLKCNWGTSQILQHLHIAGDHHPPPPSAPPQAFSSSPLPLPPSKLAYLISRWIMLLPIVTTSAAFPLFNRVLAANLQPLLPLPLRSKRTAAVICALPPLLLTACIRDTALVFSLCGLAGFCIVWFVPAALQHAAMRASVRRWGEAGRLTPHSTSFSGPFTVVAVAAVGGIAFAYNLWVVVVAPVVARLV